MSIYKSKPGRKKSLRLYDEQMQKLAVAFSDIYVDTSFRETHLIDTGNKNGKPLFVFHSGILAKLMCVAPKKIEKAVLIM